VRVKSFKIESIPPSRLVWMVVILMFQLVILVVLLIWGKLWLINATGHGPVAQRVGPELYHRHG